MNARSLPRSSQSWLALGVLPPKTFAVAAYPMFMLCIQLAPRDGAVRSWAFALLLGYVLSFIWLVLGCLGQIWFGSSDGAKSTGWLSILALLLIWRLWPSLYGGFG